MNNNNNSNDATVLTADDMNISIGPLTFTHRVLVRQQKALSSRLQLMMRDRYYPTGCAISFKYSPGYDVCDIVHIWGFSNTYGVQILNVECMLGLKYSDSLNLNSRLNNMFLAAEIHKALDAGVLLMIISNQSDQILDEMESLIQHNASAIHAGDLAGRVDILTKLVPLMPVSGWNYSLIANGLASYELFHFHVPEKDLSTGKWKPSGEIVSHDLKEPLMFRSHVSPIFVTLNMAKQVPTGSVDLLAKSNDWSDDVKLIVERMSKMGSELLGVQALKDFRPPEHRGTRQGQATAIQDEPSHETLPYASLGELTRQRMATVDETPPTRPVTPDGRFMGNLNHYVPADRYKIGMALNLRESRLRRHKYNDEQVAGWNEEDPLGWE